MEELLAGTRSTIKTKPNKKPVMFMSFGLADAETRYYTTKKEVLAVLRCLEEVRWLVYRSKFSVLLYTDHMAILGIMRGSDNPSARVIRWQYRLQEYNLEVVYVPRKLQQVADGLSRIPSWRVLIPGYPDEPPLPLFCTNFQIPKDTEPRDGEQQRPLEVIATSQRP